MSEAAITAPTPVVAAKRESIFAGHPKGLGPLFFTELWERFSYYGMRAILIFYLTAAAAEGGLGWDVKNASAIWGWYVFSVYITALPGGLIADYLTGARKAVFIGGCIIALGHFSMVYHSPNSFYAGLALIAIGTGLLKPNISAMVGGLYKADDPRRDSGFSIFYMGINIGALAAPLAITYLAQGDSFKGFLTWIGMDPKMSWHWGFGASGVGMVIGLLVYLWNGKKLAHVGNTLKTRSKLKAEEATTEDNIQPALTKGDWKRIAAIFIFFLFTILFWAAYEQKGASLTRIESSLDGRQLSPINYSWNFSFQRTLPKGMVLEAGYVGRSARNLLAVNRETGPVQIDRKNMERIVRVNAEPEVALSDAVVNVQQRLGQIRVPQDFSVGFGSEVEEQSRSFNQLKIVLILAVLLVYAVMASQYESLRDPFIIMFSIPTASIGIVGGLLLTRTAFSMQAYIGVIMLAGIVVSNAILLVDYINTLRRRDGMPLREAVEIGGRTRLRPVLMTSIATMRQPLWSLSAMALRMSRRQSRAVSNERAAPSEVTK